MDLSTRSSYSPFSWWGWPWSGWHDHRLGKIDRAIKDERAAVDLMPGGSDKLERRKVLVGLHMRRLEMESLESLDEDIEHQQAKVQQTPTGDPDKPKHLAELSRLLSRRFEHQTTLQQAIKHQQAVLDLTPAGLDKQAQLVILGGLIKLPFQHQRMLEDLEGAISDQWAAVALTSVDNHWEMETRWEDLKSLLERRLQTVGNRNREMDFSLRVSATVPTMPGGRAELYESIKDKLFQDLQQISRGIKNSKHRELDAALLRMEHAIFCLDFQGGDKLCQDMFETSTRLGAYCQALRNRAGTRTDQRELEDLYKEFVRIEREFSAAHDHSSSKYEQLYKQWRAERQNISNFLSKGASKSQSGNLEVLALVEQVDVGFERIGSVLKNEANDLKNLSETLARLSKLVHLPPDPPIGSGDAEKIPPHPPDSPPTTVGVSTQVDEVISVLSQVDALVEKSRYNKARKVVSETSSKTARKLKKLRLSSEDYDEESQILRTCRNDHSHDTRNRQRELCGQLSSLVSGMRQMLKGIVKGFAGCKASIQGLVFRPLGELLCDLEQHLPQAGLEVTAKGLHPDLILYEAALQAIADSIPAQYKLMEGIKGSISMLDKFRGM